MSGLPFRIKFILLDILLLLTLITSLVSMVNAVNRVSSEEYDRLEKNAISAAEQTTNVGIENAVSIAKNIYTNKPLYDFLNITYASSADYFEAYRPILQNTALGTADTNVVKKCIIYTENPTIKPGGNIGSVSSIKNEEWYKAIKKYNKPTLMSIDHSDHSILLVRKLDYVALDTGESFLCLKMSSDFIKNFVKSLDFDGLICIMCGSDLIYCSDEKIKSVSDITITPDFEGITHNYYTVDIEFYSCANKKSAVDILLGEKYLLPCLIAIFVLFNIALFIIGHSVVSRMRPVIKEFRSRGSLPSLEKGRNGKDEIGALLDICTEMSERLALTGSEYRESSDSLIQKSSDYDSLFTTALRLDAQLAARRSLPFISDDFDSDSVSLSDEADMIEKLAKELGKEYSRSGADSSLLVPTYSLVLIADDIFRVLGADSVSVTSSDSEATVTFIGSKPAGSADTLKLLAIFEDNDISGEYSFDSSNRFNPYLRIKHCLGSSVDINIVNKNELRISFVIHTAKEE